jgi:RNA polymerase sigma-70 factor (ECF subfamily)
MWTCNVGYDQAQDAAAEACADLFSRWGGVEHPYAYARTAAVRVVIKARERGDERLRHRLAQQGGVAEGREDPGLTAWEDREWVVSLLCELPPAQREVMSWVVDEFTPAEVALLLGRTPAAVRRALADARARLKRELVSRRAGEAAAKFSAACPVPAVMTASEEVR